MKHYILNLRFLNINRYVRNARKKRRLVYVMTTYLRQHGLMSIISLNIPEREINLHFVNSAGLIFQSITEVPQNIRGTLRMFSHPDPWQCFYQEVANLKSSTLLNVFLPILKKKCKKNIGIGSRLLEVLYVTYNQRKKHKCQFVFLRCRFV